MFIDNILYDFLVEASKVRHKWQRLSYVEKIYEAQYRHMISIIPYCDEYIIGKYLPNIGKCKFIFNDIEKVWNAIVNLANKYVRV